MDFMTGGIPAKREITVVKSESVFIVFDVITAETLVS